MAKHPFGGVEDRVAPYLLKSQATRKGHTMNQYQQPERPAQPIVINNATQEKKRTNHGLHLLLTILTLGAWLPIWIIVALVNG